MNALFTAKGPFQGCTTVERKPANPALPVASVPNGLSSQPIAQPTKYVLEIERGKTEKLEQRMGFGMLDGL